ncbi:hypothetical protein D3C85_1010580 [compost metagenome]
MRRGPDGAAVLVLQVAERAPVVAGTVFAPAGHGQVSPTARAGATVGDHDMVATVGQKLHLGNRRVGGVQHSHGRFGLTWRGGTDDRQLGGLGVGGRGARNALLQQEHGRLEGRVRFKAGLHRASQQYVRDRQESHSLVMRHVRIDDCAGLARRQSARRVVDGLVEAVAAKQAFLGEALQVPARLVRRHHQRQHGCVGRHHHVVGQASLQTQARHAERPVLIVHADVEQVIRAFGHAPGDAELVAVLDLGAHGRHAGLLQQRVGVGRHDEPGHQIFEHRAAPREEHRAARGGAELPAQGKPGFLRKLALRNGDEAAKAGFGGKQVVKSLVAPALGQVVADGQQAAALVVQEPIIGHRHLRQRVGQQRDQGQAFVGALRRQYHGKLGLQQPGPFLGRDIQGRQPLAQSGQ